MEAKFTFTRAVFWIVFSTVLVSGSVYTTYFCYQKFNRSRETDPHYQIGSVLQANTQSESIKCEYLAELMGLSVDKPSNLYVFDTDEAEKKIVESPLIRRAKVEKIFPSTVFVEYDLRQPIALLHDYENTAIDVEKYVFPLNPFFSPKDLPEIYVVLSPSGEEESLHEKKGAVWNEPIKNRYMDLALKLYSLLMAPEFKERIKLKRIDVSNAYAESYGRREIVVILEETFALDHKLRKITCVFPRILRLNSKDYEQQLGNYLVLSEQMVKDYQKQIALSNQVSDLIQFENRIIDLRISKLAFVQEE